MPQHFLLTAEARSLSVREVFALSDEEAFDLLRQLRWGKGEEVSRMRGRGTALVSAQSPPVAL